MVLPQNHGEKRANESPTEENYQSKKQKTENEKFMESLFQSLDQKSLPSNLLQQNSQTTWNPLPLSSNYSSFPHHHTTNL